MAKIIIILIASALMTGCYIQSLFEDRPKGYYLEGKVDQLGGCSEHCSARAIMEDGEFTYISSYHPFILGEPVFSSIRRSDGYRWDNHKNREYLNLEQWNNYLNGIGK